MDVPDRSVRTVALLQVDRRGVGNRGCETIVRELLVKRRGSIIIRGSDGVDRTEALRGSAIRCVRRGRIV